MKGIAVIGAALFVILIGVNFGYAQDMRLATFQETAQVIVDRSISQNVTASVTLQSTSIQELRIPAELEQRIREDGRVQSVIVTNQNQCILGVVDEACILINVARDTNDKGVTAIQQTTKDVANSFIDEINDAFDTDAKLHSVFIHTDDKSNVALGTSGAISGRGTVSAVYTMNMESSDSMFDKVSAILIPQVIRESGGFFDIAKNLSRDDNAKVTFSLIPVNDRSLMQLKLSVDYPNQADKVKKFSPLEFLQVEQIKRSEYFSQGNYPLNSIIQIAIMSPNSEIISDIKGNIVPTQVIDDEKFPTDISKQGWIFDPESGESIQAKYIFGQDNIVSKDNLVFTIGEEIKESQVEFDESIIVVIIIAIVAIGAALFYLKGYKK
ncbi:MAG: hypothetical protein ACW9WZ_00110 [Nitrosopumilus sp.]